MHLQWVCRTLIVSVNFLHSSSLTVYAVLLIDSSMRIGCVVFDQVKFFELRILECVEIRTFGGQRVGWCIYRWNSTSWDEFSRKWNKPVHSFLLRHVYAPLIYSCGFSKTIAMLITFFLSASAHELVMVVVTQKIRWVDLVFSWYFPVIHFHLEAIPLHYAGMYPYNRHLPKHSLM